MIEHEKDVIVGITDFYAETDGGDIVAPNTAKEGTLTHDDDGSFPINALGKLVRKTRRSKKVSLEIADLPYEEDEVVLGEVAQSLLDAYIANGSRVEFTNGYRRALDDGSISPEESTKLIELIEKTDPAVTPQSPLSATRTRKYRDGISAAANDFNEPDE